MDNLIGLFVNSVFVSTILLAYFLGIDGAKFRNPTLPGSVLKLHVEVLKAGSRAGKLRAEAYLDSGKMAAEANMSFAIVPKNS